MLDKLDHKRLQGVHPLLIACVFRAEEQVRRHEYTLFPHCIRVTSGVRTIEEQRELVRRGASQTMKSYHLDGLAVDLAILTKDRSKALWEIGLYRRFNMYMQEAAEQLGARLTWGGTWPKLVDGVHWQLEGETPLQRAA